MEPKQVQGNTQLSPTLPLEQQQPALDVEKIKFLKGKIKDNLFEGPGIDGKIEIKNGSLFCYTQNSLNNRVEGTDKQNAKLISEKQSKRYYDMDGNGTFETLIVETRDLAGNLKKITKYGKSQGHDDNVSNFDIEIPLNRQTK